jgi:hypothetical protein
MEYDTDTCAAGTEECGTEEMQLYDTRRRRVIERIAMDPARESNCWSWMRERPSLVDTLIRWARLAPYPPGDAQLPKHIAATVVDDPVSGYSTVTLFHTGSGASVRLRDAAGRPSRRASPSLFISPDGKRVAIFGAGSGNGGAPFPEFVAASRLSPLELGAADTP